MLKAVLKLCKLIGHHHTAIENGPPTELNLYLPPDRLNAGLPIGSQTLWQRLQEGGARKKNRVKTYIIHINNWLTTLKGG